ncbi:MAG: hypothetical protein AB7N65_30455, partial [Vicinamibacterales bacterium]
QLRCGQRVSLQALPPILPADYRPGGVDALRDAVQRRLKDAAMGEDMAAPRRFVPSRDSYWMAFLMQ